ncbi:MAP3K15 [Cordylochernes scorpioides]|uniref:MAP3K15 n=1 Tax=Cordylochernes scorpioides TaxID=51811 RepID=A0ABY6JYB1_9ARAC|nr:MAP3K15 [Cordylochernes scorpioides]
MRKRLDDPAIISSDVVYNMLINFREIQDYDAMVKLVEDLKKVPKLHFNFSPDIEFLYIFAINRRNGPKDRAKALKVVQELLKDEKYHSPDMLGLCGRIYKDIFVKSDYKDMESLENAIHWYRKSFEINPNEYGGVNLATLLVIQGNNFDTCKELQEIGRTLNILIGRKGNIANNQDYWDVATFFEMSVLADNHNKAIEAAECMFRLTPPLWYLSLSHLS